MNHAELREPPQRAADVVCDESHHTGPTGVTKVAKTWRTKRHVERALRTWEQHLHRRRAVLTANLAESIDRQKVRMVELCLECDLLLRERAQDIRHHADALDDQRLPMIGGSVDLAKIAAAQQHGIIDANCGPNVVGIGSPGRRRGEWRVGARWGGRARCDWGGLLRLQLEEVIKELCGVESQLPLLLRRLPLRRCLRPPPNAATVAALYAQRRPRPQRCLCPRRYRCCRPAGRPLRMRLAAEHVAVSTRQEELVRRASRRAKQLRAIRQPPHLTATRPGRDRDATGT
mmetsp:Transcript_5487/g.12643  ORF Transcript_5487/g.12643 Transcript_5487/m.12643 type:complete len:288 (-) Transcript_5487:34-897(-)